MQPPMKPANMTESVKTWPTAIWPLTDRKMNSSAPAIAPANAENQKAALGLVIIRKTVTAAAQHTTIVAAIVSKPCIRKNPRKKASTAVHSNSLRKPN
jgi:hypothetical protein